MSDTPTIRVATEKDVDTIVEFTLQEAFEAEGRPRDAADVRRGVEAAFDDPSLARYWVLEDDEGRIIASTSIVTEWSDFTGGFYWWIQSLFIVTEHRGRGLLERLIDHLAGEAKGAGAKDLRLYAHSENERALRAYDRCGFRRSPYTILTRDLRKG